MRRWEGFAGPPLALTLAEDAIGRVCSRDVRVDDEGEDVVIWGVFVEEGAGEAVRGEVIVAILARSAKVSSELYESVCATR